MTMEEIKEDFALNDDLPDEIDFSNARPNPYAKMFNSSVSLNINNDLIEYFKEQSEESLIPFPTYINLVLADYAKSGKRINLNA